MKFFNSLFIVSFLVPSLVAGMNANAKSDARVWPTPEQRVFCNSLTAEACQVSDVCQYYTPLQYNCIGIDDQSDRTCRGAWWNNGGRFPEQPEMLERAKRYCFALAPKIGCQFRDPNQPVCIPK